MIVELEFIRYLPRAGGVVASAYEKDIAEGSRAATLRGYWSVDVGELNSAALLWTLDSDAARHPALGEDGGASWPDSLGETVLSSESMMLRPASFNGALQAGTYGEIYEIRIYDYQPGSVETVEERWAEMVDARRAISPLIGCFSSSGERVDKWVHIWAYADGRAREVARERAAVEKIWPPNTGEWLVHQENMIVLPAAFSPLH